MPKRQVDASAAAGLTEGTGSGCFASTGQWEGQPSSRAGFDTPRGGVMIGKAHYRRRVESVV